jgi:hypothetical protein
LKTYMRDHLLENDSNPPTDWIASNRSCPLAPRVPIRGIHKRAHYLTRQALSPPPLVRLPVPHRTHERPTAMCLRCRSTMHAAAAG